MLFVSSIRAPFRAKNSLPISLSQEFLKLQLRQALKLCRSGDRLRQSPRGAPERDPAVREESARKEGGEWRRKAQRGLNVSGRDGSSLSPGSQLLIPRTG